MTFRCARSSCRLERLTEGADLLLLESLICDTGASGKLVWLHIDTCRWPNEIKEQNIAGPRCMYVREIKAFTTSRRVMCGMANLSWPMLKFAEMTGKKFRSNYKLSIPCGRLADFCS